MIFMKIKTPAPRRAVRKASGSHRDAAGGGADVHGRHLGRGVAAGSEMVGGAGMVS
jgi:hypothetical protein